MTLPIRRNIIGPSVRRLRNQEGISQEEFAARCQLKGWDITRTMLAKIEEQKRQVNDAELVMLCRMLKVEPGDLLAGGKSGDVKAVIRHGQT